MINQSRVRAKRVVGSAVDNGRREVCQDRLVCTFMSGRSGLRFGIIITIGHGGRVCAFFWQLIDWGGEWVGVGGLGYKLGGVLSSYFCYVSFLVLTIFDVHFVRSIVLYGCASCSNGCSDRFCDWQPMRFSFGRTKCR